MGTANRNRPPDPPEYDGSQEWLLVGSGEIQTDRWPGATGLVKPSLWMLCIRADGAFLRWSFAPVGGDVPDWSHTERKVEDLAHIAHRRHLAGTAA